MSIITGVVKRGGDYRISELLLPWDRPARFHDPPRIPSFVHGAAQLLGWTDRRALADLDIPGSTPRRDSSSAGQTDDPASVQE